MNTRCVDCWNCSSRAAVSFPVARRARRTQNAGRFHRFRRRKLLAALHNQYAACPDVTDTSLDSPAASRRVRLFEHTLRTWLERSPRSRPPSIPRDLPHYDHEQPRRIFLPLPGCGCCASCWKLSCQANFVSHPTQSAARDDLRRRRSTRTSGSSNSRGFTLQSAADMRDAGHHRPRIPKLTKVVLRNVHIENAHPPSVCRGMQA